MKIILLFSAVLFVNISFSQNTITSKKYATLEFVYLEHGLAQVIRGTEVKSNKSPTGTRGWLRNFEIIKASDSIPLVLKNNFGVVYMINAKDTVDINVEIEWLYPEKIINEKGEKFKSIKYTTQRPTNTPSASSYSLDEPYEMIKGNWEMNIYLEKKKVYSKTFFLY